MAVRVLIVDDEKTIVEALREILGKGGFDIAGWAYDGEEAARTYAALSPRPDVVIMDHVMPTRNGIEAMVDILKLDPLARVLFVSADTTVRKAAIAAGAAGFMDKPFRLTELLAMIRDLAK